MLICWHYINNSHLTTTTILYILNLPSSHHSLKSPYSHPCSKTQKHRLSCSRIAVIFKSTWMASPSQLCTYIRNPPIRSDPITTFVINAVDPLRVLELHFDQVPKEQLQKKYSKTILLKRSQFNKVFRVSYDKSVTLAMH